METHSFYLKTMLNYTQKSHPQMMISILDILGEMEEHKLEKGKHL